MLQPASIKEVDAQANRGLITMLERKYQASLAENEEANKIAENATFDAMMANQNRAELLMKVS